ncbi:DUF3379 family protein [Aliikangiella sp. G2MR2-5]|uniref:DUF3379 family protein n=1 Tax=Aliikangiella sp. G2MR2-5 TaxID=2788943 RepID=UPI0018AA853E|nr:DUF3379 family protein [Aliikangiella sp. G2MR2-5]
MDELNKKRNLKADPRSWLEQIDDKVLAEMSPQQRENVLSDKAFEKLLDKGMDIPVPVELSDKILLNQSTQNKRFYPAVFSIAASVVLITGLWLLFPRPESDFGSEAIAHVKLESEYLYLDKTIGRQTLDNRMKAMGLSLPKLPEEVVFAVRCHYAGQEAMHMIAKIDGQPVSLLMTKNKITEEGFFEDSELVGRFTNNLNQQLVVIARKSALIDRFISQISEG